MACLLGDAGDAAAAATAATSPAAAAAASPHAPARIVIASLSHVLIERSQPVKAYGSTVQELIEVAEVSQHSSLTCQDHECLIVVATCSNPLLLIQPLEGLHLQPATYIGGERGISVATSQLYSLHKTQTPPMPASGALTESCGPFTTRACIHVHNLYKLFGEVVQLLCSRHTAAWLMCQECLVRCHVGQCARAPPLAPQCVCTGWKKYALQLHGAHTLPERRNMDWVTCRCALQQKQSSTEYAARPQPTCRYAQLRAAATAFSSRDT